MGNFERIVYMDRAIREEGGFVVSKVAERFEVSPRQIKRDIEYLRDRLGAPIVYKTAQRRHTYAKPWTTLSFTDEKLLILNAIFQTISANHEYVPIASQDVIEELKNRVAGEYKKMADRIRFEIPVAESTDMETFTAVCKAIRDKRRLEIGYTNAQDKTSEREVEAERLVNYSGRWYLIAWDCSKEALRTFHLARIQKMKITGSCSLSEKSRLFEARQKAVEEFLDSSFGMFKGKAVKKAVIRIYGETARLVARQVWHPAQKITMVESGPNAPYLDLQLPVADYSEILGRVLSFGSKAEAVAPEEFRVLWKDEVKKMGSRI